MLKKTFFSLILLPLQLCLQAYGQDAIKLLQGASLKCKSVPNGYIEAELFTKYPRQKDTFYTSVKGYFKKIKTDSIFPIAFHFDFGYQSHDAGSLLFTGKDFVEYHQYDSTATILSGDLWAKHIKNYHTDKKIYTPITDKSGTPLPQNQDYTDGRHQFQLLGNESLNGQLYYHVRVKETPQHDKISDLQILSQQNDFWIRRDSIPIQYSIKIRSTDKIDTFSYYQKVVLTNYRLNDTDTDSAFELTSIPAFCKLQMYAPKKKSLINVNEMAPKWTLHAIDGKTIKLADFKGKVVVLDFFYKSCYPCALAIPGLNSLYEKYKDKGLVVIGIDPNDSKEENELKQFMVKRKIKYTILLEDFDSSGSVSNTYFVSAFPTLYIIDKDGKIIHSQEGYSEQMDLLVEDIIDKNL